jgi:SAM-dependent methyltransferase
MDKNDKLFLRLIDDQMKDYWPESMDEGFGTYYERVIMHRFLRKLISNHDIETIFEGPSDGISGIKGINSLPMVNKGRELIYYTPSERERRFVEKTWNIIEHSTEKKMNVEVRSGPMSRFPFEDNSFDLVWNFCVMEHLINPLSVFKEMTRVSKRYILLAVQNAWNLGTFPHLIYHRVKGKPWDHGNVKWMSLAGIRALLKGVKIIEVKKSSLFVSAPKIIEKGMFDIPVWPDTWDMGVPGLSTKTSSSQTSSKSQGSLSNILGKKGNALMGIASLIERGSMPKKVKILWAHHIYALCEK